MTYILFLHNDTLPGSMGYIQQSVIRNVSMDIAHSQECVNAPSDTQEHIVTKVSVILVMYIA